MRGIQSVTKRISNTVKAGRVLVSDGAWGTQLLEKGLKGCPEEWNLKQFDEVADIAKAYAKAGADLVKTNSFGGNRYKLEHYGYADRVSEINEVAARATVKGVHDADAQAWIIASMGPTGKMLIIEEVTKDEMYQAFRQQAIALEKGGANAVCIETMSDIDEAVTAVRAVSDNTELEIICTFTFERTLHGDYRTMMGVTPVEAAQAVLDAGADIIGTNCGNGIERMIDIVADLRSAFPNVPILVHANAGLPHNENGIDIFPDTPEDMVKHLPALLKAGANIVGGCCGTTPEHIRAIKDFVLNTISKLK